MLYEVITATEVGGVAALAAIIIGVFIYRELTWKQVWETIKESSLQTAVIMLIVATSAVLGWYLTNEGIPQQLARGMLRLPDNRYSYNFVECMLYEVITRTRKRTSIGRRKR